MSFARGLDGGARRGVPSAAVFALTVTTLSALAQGVRVDRPPAGTLRRGILGLESPSAPAVVLWVTVALVALVVVAAIVRRARRR